MDSIVIDASYPVRSANSATAGNLVKSPYCDDVITAAWRK